MNEEEEENEESIHSRYDVHTFDDAVTIDLMSINREMHDEDSKKTLFDQIVYLESIYQLITSVINNPEWRPEDDFTRATLPVWEERLWIYFLTRERELNTYEIENRKTGFTVHTMLWIVLCGLSMINDRWREKNDIERAYDSSIRGSQLPFVFHDHSLVMKDVPVNKQTVNDIMSHLYCLISNYNRLRYHPEIQIWIHLLYMRTAELLFSIGDKNVFDSIVWCTIRSQIARREESTNTILEYQTLYAVTDEFILLSSQLFYSLMSPFLQRMTYPRHVVTFRPNFSEYRFFRGPHLIHLFT